jgi:hypothetical protein
MPRLIVDDDANQDIVEISEYYTAALGYPSSPNTLTANSCA